MHRIPVKSSQIKAIGYDPISKKLDVEFHPRGETPGGVYQYDDVPIKVHQAFKKSESTGSHFHAHIKGKYTHTKLP